mmetsp:Transcript_7374/g.21531  ORF Transcript_7374/g.21531 Transcript_7374/m.21531 type:complete len:227 (-) Transcript_7374:211-891(-)
MEARVAARAAEGTGGCGPNGMADGMAEVAGMLGAGGGSGGRSDGSGRSSDGSSGEPVAALRVASGGDMGGGGMGGGGMGGGKSVTEDTSGKPSAGVHSGIAAAIGSPLPGVRGTEATVAGAAAVDGAPPASILTATSWSRPPACGAIAGSGTGSRAAATCDELPAPATCDELPARRCPSSAARCANRADSAATCWRAAALVLFGRRRCRSGGVDDRPEKICSTFCR